MKRFIDENRELMYSMLKEMCLIPAPSGYEDERARYCKERLLSFGASGVYIDEAKNVVFGIGCEGSSDITVIAAHTDTVFPGREPMPYSDDGNVIRCPGVGDDTASVVVLMLSAKWCIEHSVKPRGGILFVCDSCEEGLGNLKGVRRIFEDYAGRISRFITLDSGIGSIVDRCVGSHRYELTVKTEGGHSYSAFGNRSAIAELSRIIGEIYSIDVPKREKSKTTYNVGIISGGTSVNTIAEEASMLAEYRSDDQYCLALMKEKFSEIFARAESRVGELRVELVGDRPCMGDVDIGAQESLASLCSDVITRVAGITPTRRPGSTDCNIPLSLGIPAVSIGVYYGGGAHTMEEYLKRDSLTLGLEISLSVVEKLL
jgi:acetylornithine deacetylase/succinyl-diaminopimelate desuccinylase-like protein